MAQKGAQSGAQAGVLTLTTRRDRFREYMSRLNPTAPARRVVEAGLVCLDPKQSLHKHLAARAELDPGSQQLLVGGVGSGKTTELMLVEQELHQTPHVLPLFVDVTAQTDLSHLDSGALLASVAKSISNWMAKDSSSNALPEERKKSLREASKTLREFVVGKTEIKWISGPEDRDPETVDSAPEDPHTGAGQWVRATIPGKLKPPVPKLRPDIEAVVKPLGVLLEYLRERKLEAVTIFDGLDRLIAAERFWAVAHQDLRVLRALKISTVLAAPLALLYGEGKDVSDHFDRVHHLPAISGGCESGGLLRSILLQRGIPELLDETAVTEICAASGGVLRDLITLARDAGEEAYVSGADRIRMEDVRVVVGRLGSAYRRGLGPAQVHILRLLAQTGFFDVSMPRNLELLLSRRVLEYSDTELRVHPALLPLVSSSDKHDG